MVGQYYLSLAQQCYGKGSSSSIRFESKSVFMILIGKSKTTRKQHEIKKKYQIILSICSVQVKMSVHISNSCRDFVKTSVIFSCNLT